VPLLLKLVVECVNHSRNHQSVHTGVAQDSIHMMELQNMAPNNWGSIAVEPAAVGVQAQV